MRLTASNAIARVEVGVLTRIGFWEAAVVDTSPDARSVMVIFRPNQRLEYTRALLEKELSGGRHPVMNLTVHRLVYHRG